MPIPLLALIPLLAPLIPRIAEWIGGDESGGVASQVANVVSSVAGSMDPATVAAVLADPNKAGEIATEIARVGAERDRVLQEQITARLVAGLQDTANARSQTVELAKTGGLISWSAPIVSILVLVMFGAAFTMVMLVDRSYDERTTTIVNSLMGAMTLAFGSVINYWLGSSRGSAAKEEARASEASTAATVAQAALDAAPVVRSILRRS